MFSLKNCLLSVLLLWIPYIHSSVDKLQEIGLLATQIDITTFNLTCVATGDASKYALAWIGDDFSITEHNKALLSSRYRNSIIKISGLKNISSPWHIGTNQHRLPPVIDYRWEDFKTQKINDFKSTNFTLINISIRFNSYPIIKLTIAGITICVQLDKTVDSTNFESSKCQTLKDLPTYHYPWYHYSIYKYDDKMYITSTFNKIPKNIQIFEVIDMQITSSRNVEWKLHNYEYLWTTEDISTIPINISTDNTKNNCVAIPLFVHCQQCDIVVKLLDTNQRIHDNQTILSGNEWNEVQLCISINNNLKEMYLQLVHYVNNSDRFFAIGDIRTYHKNDMNTLTISNARNQYYSCQSFGPTNTITDISYTNKVKYLSSDFKHIHSFFKEICSVLGKGSNCKKHLLCNSLGKCGCAFGYDDDYCDKACHSRRWGYNCMNECSYGCEDDCSIVDGHCSSCKHGYYGPQCSELYLENIPVLNMNNPTNLKINLNITKHENVSSETHKVKFQYKECIEKIKWNYTELFEISNAYLYNITNLKKQTCYAISAVICNNVSKQCHNSAKEQVLYTNTSCIAIMKTDLIFEAQEDQIKINVNKTYTDRNKMCSLNIYIVTINNLAYSLKYNTIISGLKPFTPYEVTITLNKTAIDIENALSGNWTDINKKVQTLPSFPACVENIYASDIIIRNNIHSTKITWDDPKPPMGIILGYQISVGIIHKDCESQQFFDQIEQINTIKKEADIQIELYKEYEISITAKNKKGIGAAKSLNFDTQQLNGISDRELPKSISVNQTSVFLELPDCKLVQGPLTYKFTYKCSDNWCMNIIIEETNKFSEIELPVELYSFSNYTLTVQGLRKDTRLQLHHTDGYKSTKFRSPPNKPFPVKQFEAYSKNDTSISLRWRPPYPPRGLIEIYNIISNAKYINFNLTSNQTCVLWDEYMCIDIIRLYKNTQYNIQIRAKNMDVEKYSDYSEISVVTREEESDHVQNLTYAFLNTTQVMLRWHHPNKTNGILTYFEIMFINLDKKINILETLTFDTYNKTYEFITGHQLLSASTYDVIVRGVSSLQGKQATLQIITFPEIPQFNGNVTYYYKNNVTTINLPDNNLLNTSKLWVILVDKNKPYDGSSDNANMTVYDLADATKSYLKHIVYNGTYNRSIIISNDIISQYEIVIVSANEYKGLRTYSRNVVHAWIDIPIHQSYIYIYLIISFIVAFVAIGIIAFVFYRNGYQCNKKNFKTIKKIGEHLRLLPRNNDDLEMTPKSRSSFNSIVKLVELGKFNIFDAEYESIIHKPTTTKKTDIALLPINKRRNRYQNVIPFDDNRVILINNKETDYINASYIKGHKGSKTYIATQGPKNDTINDFWTMVWQEDTTIIVSLGPDKEEKEKFRVFWGDIGITKKLANDLIIKTIDVAAHGDYTMRTIQISQNNIMRKVTHMHYEFWLDHELPMFPLTFVKFLMVVKSIDNNNFPIIVHCSAGLGRTGVFILCDNLSKLDINEIDVLGYLMEMRECRPNMVQKSLQYAFGYFTINELLKQSSTSKLIINELNIYILKSETWISTNLEYLNKLKPWMNVLYSNYIHSSYSENKNREPSIIPRGNNIIYLPRYLKEGNNSDYINAVSVNGYAVNKQYITTQQPIENTIGDFWRLVDHKNIGFIVSLQNIDLQNKLYPKFWPNSIEENMDPVDFISLKCIKITKSSFHETYIIEMIVNDKKPRNLTIFQFTSWDPNKVAPDNVECFYKMYLECNILKDNIPTLLCCSDGAIACGLYIAFDLLIRKYKDDKEFDIGWVVGSIRPNRREFMLKKEQYRFIADCLLYALQEIEQATIYENVNVNENTEYENSAVSNNYDMNENEHIYENVRLSIN